MFTGGIIIKEERVYIRVSYLGKRHYITFGLNVGDKGAAKNGQLISASGMTKAMLKFHNERISNVVDFINNELHMYLSNKTGRPLFSEEEVKQCVAHYIKHGHTEQDFTLYTLASNYIEGIKASQISVPLASRTATVRMVTMLKQAIQLSGCDVFLPSDDPLSGNVTVRKNVLAKCTKISSMLNDLADKDGMADSSRKTYQAYLNRFFKWVKSETMVELEIRMEAKQREAAVSVIDTEVAKRIINKYEEVRRKTGAGYKEIADYVVLGLLTLLRISDLKRIRIRNIRKVDDQYWLSIDHLKTGKFVDIPLPAKVLTPLLEKNKWSKRDPDEYLLPRIADSTIARKMKEFFAQQPGMDRYACHETSVNGQLEVRKEGKAHEMVTPHYLRRTGATIMLQSGVSESVVRKIGGWSANSASFNRYVSIGNEYIAEEVKQFIDKL